LVDGSNRSHIGIYPLHEKSASYQVNQTAREENAG